MKHFALLLLSLAALNFAALAQPAWNNAGGEKKLDATEINAPVLSWKSDSYDLGTIPQGKPVEVTYELTNTGNAPLIISKVEPACNCTAADFPKTPIMPGKSAKITITFDAASTGKFSKTAIVTTNAKPTDTMIVFTGTVKK